MHNKAKVQVPRDSMDNLLSFLAQYFAPRQQLPLNCATTMTEMIILI